MTALDAVMMISRLEFGHEIVAHRWLIAALAVADRVGYRSSGF
jgi:hypothetical protein